MGSLLFEKEFDIKKKFTIQDAKRIGDQLGINWKDFDAEQFMMGLNVELEHGTIDGSTNVTDDDPIKTGKIAWIHLKESNRYYYLLEDMEKKFE